MRQVCVPLKYKAGCVNLSVTYIPGILHGVLGQIDVPVDQVKEGKGQGEEDAGVLVDGAGAGQLRDLRKS